jgi:anti-anti-sigma factor
LDVDGRLDAFWADHLAEEMAAAVREGRHVISLNLSGVTYLSSAGIRVLVRF